MSKHINEALQQFARKRGITMLLDSANLPSILAVDPAADLTKDFIAEYNSKNP